MDTSNIVQLPNSPPIAGLQFRRFRDAADYAQMAAVHTGSQAWDRVDPLSARESVPTAEDLAGMFPESEIQSSPDLLLAQIDDRIIGYNHVFWRWTEVTGTRVYLHLGYLLPEWRGKGIGSTLLHWSQQHIHELIAAEPHTGPITFATNVSSTEREADTLMQHTGYDAVRRLSDMVLAPLTHSSLRKLPPQVDLRPIQPEDHRAIYQAWKDAFSAMWTSRPASEEDYQEFLADNITLAGFDPELCHIAWVGNEVVGLVFARIHLGVGVIVEVAVRKAWQRRGIAQTLMLYALNTLHDRGITQARLFTDAGNEQGARSLYERLGFHEVKQHIFYRKPVDS